MGPVGVRGEFDGRRSVMRTFLLTTFAVLSMSATAVAQPVGNFAVVGRNPGASGGPPAYTATMTVTATGDSFEVVWNFGNTRVQGRGIWVNNVFSVAYTNRAPVGPAIAAYVLRPDGTWLRALGDPRQPELGHRGAHPSLRVVEDGTTSGGRAAR